MNIIYGNKRAYVISIVLIMLCICNIYGQRTNPNEEFSIAEYRQTLLYGVDSSVIDIIKRIDNLQLKDFEDDIFVRIQETNNSELIVAGISYFRTAEYKKALDFTLNMLENYEDYSARAVQYAAFYIQDNVDILSKAHIEKLKEDILAIIDSDNPSISLAVLELLPHFYSEKDIIYQSNIEDEEDSLDTSDDEKKDDIQNTLYSVLLKQRYEESNVATIKDQIVVTLGHIEAASELEFLISLAESTTIESSRRSSALESVAGFSAIPIELQIKRKDVYDSMRAFEAPKMRSAVLKALAITLEHTYDKDYVLWLKNGLRDNNITVRKDALTAFFTIFEEGYTLEGVDSDRILLEGIQYMSKHDPEDDIKKQAVKVLGVYPNGKGIEYILEEVKKIEYATKLNKALIDSSIKKFGSQGGYSALVALIKKNDNIKKNTSLIEYIAESLHRAKLEDSSGITEIVDLLISHPESSVVLACLTTIGAYKLTKYTKNLVILSQDITKSAEVRNKAEQVITLLQEDNDNSTNN